MSRIRSIKPEFWSSKSLARLSRASRLTFIGLWGMCDDVGVMLDVPKTIAGELYPHDDDVESADIEKQLDELAHAGFIYRVSEKGKDYIIIRSWDEHQKIDKPSKHRWLSREDRDHLSNGSRVIRETLSMGDGKGTEEKENNISSVSNSDELDEQSEKAERHPAPDKELILDLVDIWNSEAALLGLAQVRDITPKRQSALRGRIKDFPIYGFDGPRDGFRALMGRIRASPFLLGQTSANFQADFDFAVRQGSFTKIMEGSYEAKNKTASGAR